MKRLPAAFQALIKGIATMMMVTKKSVTEGYL